MRNPELVRSWTLMARPVQALAVLVIVNTLSGCMPPFAEMQGARLTGVGRAEITPHLTRTLFAENGEVEQLYNNLGVSVSTGLSPRSDFRLTFVRSVVVDEPGEGFNVIGFGPKFSLSPNRAALFVPIGFGIAEGLDISNTLQTHPTLLFTTPLGRGAELNTSLKALIPLAQNEAELLVGATIGLAIGRDISKWAIRPEVAFLRNPGEDGTAISAGVGMTFGLGGARPRAP